MLGTWLYGQEISSLEDKEILRLVEEMKPIHQAIHESAQTILKLNETDPQGAQQMYLDNTKANVVKLVALLDQVAEITKQQVEDDEAGLSAAVLRTQIISVITVLIILVVCILLVIYVFRGIVAPIQKITESSRSLSEVKPQHKTRYTESNRKESAKEP